MNAWEVQHDRRWRMPDSLSVVAAVVVAGTIVGQIWILTRILGEQRPRRMKVEASYVSPSQPVKPTPQTELPPASPAVASHVAVPAPPRSEPSGAQTLNRRIRIARVNRNDAPTAVTLTIQAQARSEERTLDAAAVRIGVQFFGTDTTGSAMPIDEPVWLSIPTWENFTTKWLTAQCPAAPAEVTGFVVRSYYRGQLQDVFAVPPALVSREF